MEAVANGMASMSVAYRDLVRAVTVLALLGTDRVVMEAQAGRLRVQARYPEAAGATCVVELHGVTEGELPPVEVPLRALAADLAVSERCSLELTRAALVVHAAACTYRVPTPARLVHGPDPLESHQLDPLPVGWLGGAALAPVARALGSSGFDNDPLEVAVLDHRGQIGARGARRFAVARLEEARLDATLAIPGRLVRVAEAFRPERLQIVADQACGPRPSYVRLLAVEGDNLCVLEAPVASVPPASLLGFFESPDRNAPLLEVEDAQGFFDTLARFSEYLQVSFGQGPDEMSTLVGTDEHGEQLSTCFRGTVHDPFEVSPMDLRFLLLGLQAAATLTRGPGGVYPLRVAADDGTTRGVLRAV